MKEINFLIYGLAVWRVTNILIYENGPFHLCAKWRKYMYLSSEFTKELSTCPLCLSVWIATILLFVPEKIKLIFAGSAFSVILNTKVDY